MSLEDLRSKKTPDVPDVSVRSPTLFRSRNDKHNDSSTQQKSMPSTSKQLSYDSIEDFKRGRASTSTPKEDIGNLTQSLDSTTDDSESQDLETVHNLIGSKSALKSSFGNNVIKKKVGFDLKRSKGSERNSTEEIVEVDVEDDFSDSR